MDRRGFLKLFAAAAPVAAIAPKYFFAPIGGWQSDVIHSPWTTIGIGMMPPRSNVMIYNVKAPIIEPGEALFFVNDEHFRFLQHLKASEDRQLGLEDLRRVNGRKSHSRA